MEETNLNSKTDNKYNKGKDKINLTNKINITDYINSLHPSDSYTKIKDSLSIIVEQETPIKPILSGLLKDNLNCLTDLISTVELHKSILQNTNSAVLSQQAIKFEGFKDKLRIKKFESQLKFFEENLDIFTNQSRKLLLSEKNIEITKNTGESLRKNDIRDQKGIIVMTDDIIILGGQLKPEKYSLLTSFDYKMVEILNQDKILESKTETGTKLELKTPTANYTIKAPIKTILRILSVFETIKYSKKSYKKANNIYEQRKKLKRISYLIKTEQYDKIDTAQFVDKKDSKLSIFSYNTDSIISSNNNQNETKTTLEKKLSRKNLKLLLKYSHSKEVFLLIRNLVDEQVLFFELFKRNIPDYPLEKNFIDVYFDYYQKFIKENKKYLDENLLLILKEKYLKYIIKKIMKLVLIKYRKISEVNELFDKVRNKLTVFKYLLRKYENKLEKFEEERKRMATKKLTKMVDGFTI